MPYKDPEKKKKHNKEYYEKHRTKRRRQIRKYMRENPEKVLAWDQKRYGLLVMAPGGSFFSAKVKAKIAARWLHQDTCYYCKKNLRETYDHAIPLSRGGSNFAANIYPTCRRCNSQKGAKILYKEWTPPSKREPR